jgi:hypothetical protein
LNSEPFLPAPGRPSFRPIAAAGLVLCLVAAECARAADAAVDVKEDIRIGLPGKQATHRRASAWAPVYVPLEATADVARGQFQLVLESTDGDDVPFRIAHSLPALAANERSLFIAYLPPCPSSRFTLTLRDAGGSLLKDLASRVRTGTGRDLLEPHEVLTLALGSVLPVGTKAGKQAANDNPAPEGDEAPSTAVIHKVEELPDRWYGYDAVDVIFLTTSNDDFMAALLDGKSASRRAALAEWVSRGGRLVISVGRNAQQVAKLLEGINCGCEIKGKNDHRKSLPSLVAYAGREEQGRQPKWGNRVEIANFVPGPGLDVLVREDAVADDPERPLLVQAAYGLGRIVLIAFDIDKRPFTDAEGPQAVWKKVQADFIPRAGNAQQEELATRLRDSLEPHGEVPVISFGWVALFLLGYIALVGPIDYFVLKKIFKRLELTWITFPIVVIIVSVAAYLVAYGSKGNDLWTTKVDLVDIDLHGESPQVQGTTWWSVFNPRSQSFTVGLEPAASTWFTPAGDGKAAPATVSVLASPTQGVPGSPGMVRRPYEYTSDGTGLRDVPVPVWATRHFTGSWHLSLARPPVDAELKVPRDGVGLTGTFVNRLPVELQGATLIFGERLYRITGSLMPGEPLEVSSLFEKRNLSSYPLTDWDRDDSLRPQPAATPQEVTLPRAQGALASYLAIKPALFYSLKVEEQGNSELRLLDQAWRLQRLPTREVRYPSQAVLVARAPVVADKAETVFAGPQAPSRLWLGALPGSQEHRPAVDGYIAQETYVRIFIPVRQDR